MFENRRMPNGTPEPSLGLCGVGGRACEGSLSTRFLHEVLTEHHQATAPIEKRIHSRADTMEITAWRVWGLF